MDIFYLMAFLELKAVNSSLINPRFFRSSIMEELSCGLLAWKCLDKFAFLSAF